MYLRQLETMPLPPQLQAKYLARFDELVQRGHAIHASITTKQTPYSSSEVIDIEDLRQWETSYFCLLDLIIPRSSTQRKLLNQQEKSYSQKSALLKKIATLKAIREDFEQGFLEDIALQIEAEIAADYMEQAEGLMSEGQPGRFDHVPAAVLSGAVLEKTLRSLCSKQSPPIAITSAKGIRLTLNPLIEELKKGGIFNELKAKHLRSWADIRNAAAHGEFEKFNRSDVDRMIQGVSDFLATHVA
jgi:hypothetical protein